MMKRLIAVTVLTGVALLAAQAQTVAAQASDRVVIQLKCEFDEWPCSPDWPGK
ncbi:hypothetical protein [Longispora albida]|uniref:hypothetical protein n=1 Tax=Longispora albida TaxID=203523 RepID=UPI000371E718|nr:hypothetical protein [Longispora albida]